MATKNAHFIVISANTIFLSRNFTPCQHFGPLFSCPSFPVNPYR